MISIQDHVVSLETAKRMKELGWKKETIYTRLLTQDAEDKDVFAVSHLKAIITNKMLEELHAFAPLVTEILEELPYKVEIPTGYARIEMCRDAKQLWCAYYGSGVEIHYITKHDNLAEALALLWCELKEKHII